MGRGYCFLPIFLPFINSNFIPVDVFVNSDYNILLSIYHHIQEAT
jgi:hypothetical protein